MIARKLADRSQSPMSSCGETEEYAPPKYNPRKLPEPTEQSRASAKSRPRKSLRAAALNRIPIVENSSSDDDYMGIVRKEKTLDVTPMWNKSFKDEPIQGKTQC